VKTQLDKNVTKKVYLVPDDGSDQNWNDLQVKQFPIENASSDVKMGSKTEK